MLTSLKLKRRIITNNIYSFLQRQRLVRKDLVIVSNNCWGGDIYGIAKKEYNTPFIGLFLHAPCYIKLLKNVPNSLIEELSFKQNSKYFNQKPNYPIGVIGNDIEIHFLHYVNEKEAELKWSRRCERLLKSIENKHELFLKWTIETFVLKN